VTSTAVSGVIAAEVEELELGDRFTLDLLVPGP